MFRTFTLMTAKQTSTSHDADSSEAGNEVALVFDSVPRFQISSVSMLCWIYMLYISITSFVVANDVDDTDILINSECIVLSKLSKLQSIAAVAVLLYMAVTMSVVPICSQPESFPAIVDVESYQRAVYRSITMITIVTCAALVPITVIVMNHRVRVVGVCLITISDCDDLVPMCDGRLLTTTSNLSLFITLLFLVMLVEICCIIMVVRVRTRGKSDNDIII
jgi:hypothetical protein